MSNESPKSRTSSADEVVPVTAAHEDDSRGQDGGIAADFVGEVLINGAQLFVDGLGTAVSAVVSSLGNSG